MIIEVISLHFVCEERPGEEMPGEERPYHTFDECAVYNECMIIYLKVQFYNQGSQNCPTDT